MVSVCEDGVTKPAPIRYGWSNVPDVNLFSKRGFPPRRFEATANDRANRDFSI